jgi:hypothetical protein
MKTEGGKKEETNATGTLELQEEDTTNRGVRSRRLSYKGP